MERKFLRMDETLRYHMEWLFWLDICSFARSTSLEEPVYMYRMHGGNLHLRTDDLGKESASAYAKIAKRFDGRLGESDKRMLMMGQDRAFGMYFGDTAAVRKLLRQVLQLRPRGRELLVTCALLILSTSRPVLKRGLKVSVALARMTGQSKFLRYKDAFEL